MWLFDFEQSRSVHLFNEQPLPGAARLPLSQGED
jgi:hypothetical protein